MVRGIDPHALCFEGKKLLVRKASQAAAAAATLVTPLEDQAAID